MLSVHHQQRRHRATLYHVVRPSPTATTTARCHVMLKGIVILWLTTVIPQAKPPRAYHFLRAVNLPSRHSLVLVKQKLRQEFAGFSGNEIKELRFSGVEVCY
ncbi:hypothetical protein Droror1_Dr00012328 [Drosera rotundifolia]